jgi:hypothetical protein
MNLDDEAAPHLPDLLRDDDRRDWSCLGYARRSNRRRHGIGVTQGSFVAIVGTGFRSFAGAIGSRHEGLYLACPQCLRRVHHRCRYVLAVMRPPGSNLAGQQMDRDGFSLERWDGDLKQKLSRKFIEPPVHFLGAMVLDQKQTPTTHVERRQVIDVIPGAVRDTSFKSPHPSSAII